MEISVKNTVCATGHRDIFKNNATYDLIHPSCKLVGDTISVRLEWLFKNDGVAEVVTGGALGFDQIVFFAVESLKQKEKYRKVKNILALPFKGQESVWNESQKKWYEKMLKRADKIIYVDTVPGYTMKNPVVGYHPSKMILRDNYMVNMSRHVLACYDGSNKGGTSHTYEYAKKKEGKIIYRFNPLEGLRETVVYGG